MRSKGILALLLASTLGAGSVDPFRPALPGYRYGFPADFFNHPEYRTEWWYYTGNLHTAEGRRFGFELTFFRQGIDRDRPANIWSVRDAWLAHLALSDIEGHQFFHTERLNRSGPGLAGADAGQARVWNGNWQARWTLNPQAPGTAVTETLQAIAARFRFDLKLTAEKPPAVHGVDGVSQKSAGAGQASHYFSQTRLSANGTLVLDGKQFAVDGLAWMDHEFFTHQMSSDQVGWDWFSLQFDDNTELMLYRLRRKDGSADPFSSGTFIDAQGRTTHLSRSQFSLTPGKTWRSPVTNADYPVAWTITVAGLGLNLALETALPQQELTGAGAASPAYWEGAIAVSGRKHGNVIKGVGYLEMTGYAGRINFGE